METTNIQLLRRLVQSQQNEQAAKILDGLQRLEAKHKESAKRWIWELIQNAKDSTQGTRKIQIEVHFSQQKVQFMHSGDPFFLDHLFSLICQTSMKERSEEQDSVPETTGKFGTGFITTYLLSRIVEVEGIYKDQENSTFKKFKLSLDRSPVTKKAMIEKFNETYQLFDQLNNNSKIPPLKAYEIGTSCDTVFTYFLNDKTLLTAKEGIEDLKKSVFQVLIFNPKIASIKLVDHINAKTEEFFVKSINPLRDQLRLITARKNQEERVFCQAISDEHTSLCIELKADGGLVSILPKVLDTPVLYADFPLLGSQQKFTFPCYLNSHLFVPNEKRSYVQITEEPRYEANREIFRNAVGLFNNLFKYAVNSTWGNLHNLAIIDTPNIQSSQWFKDEVMLPIMQQIASEPIIESYNGKVSLQQVVFPDVEGILHENQHFKLNCPAERKQQIFSRLWELLLPYNLSFLIKNNFNYYNIWRNTLHSRWYEVLKKDNIVGVLPVLQNIHQSSNFDALASQLSLFVDPSKWLEKIYSFLELYINKDNRDQYLIKFKLVFNQNGQAKYVRELYLDDSIEECYKTLSKQYGYDLRERLLSTSHQEILLRLDPTLQKYSFQRLCQIMEEVILKYLGKNEKSDCRFTTLFTLLMTNMDLTYGFCLELVSLIPQEQEIIVVEKEEEQKEEGSDHSKRQQFYEWISGYDELKEKQYVRDYSMRLFELSDKVLLTDIKATILQSEDFSDFVQTIDESKDEAANIEWLKQFYSYCQDYNLSSFFQEKIILNKQKKFIKLQFVEQDQSLLFDYTESSLLEAVEPFIAISGEPKETFLNLIREGLSLYSAFIDKGIEERLIHEQCCQVLRKGMLLKSFDAKNLFNEVDKVIVKNCKELAFYKTNLKDVKALESLYLFFEKYENLQSVFFPEFIQQYKEIGFQLYTQGCNRDSITTIVKNGGEVLLQRFGQFSQQETQDLIEVIGDTSASQLIKMIMIQKEYEQKSLKKMSKRANSASSGSNIKSSCNKISQREAELYIDPEQFLVENCISNKQGLDKALPRLTSSQRLVIESHLRFKGSIAFANAEKCLTRSINNVKAHIRTLPEYDLKKWKVLPEFVNQNVVGGVLKHGAEIKLVIRPGDFSQIIFHDEAEVEALNSADLWVDKNGLTKKITLKDVIVWNKLYFVQLQL